MATPSKTVQVSFVNRAADIGRADWQALFRPMIEGRFWYETLEASQLEDQFTFFHALIRREGVLVGLAPCFVHDVPITLVAPPAVAFVLRGLAKIFPRLGYQRTLFVGSPCSDEGTIALRSGVTLAEVLPVLRTAVEARARELRAPMVVFKDFTGEDLPVLSGLEGFCPMLSYPGTVVPLPGPDKEAYYRSLSHTHRHNHRKKMRRSAELLDVETTVVARPTDAELAEIFGLFMQTYERGRTKFERLGLPFFAAIREQPEARFILLRERGGALVAFMLVFVLGDRVVNKFIGLDYGRDPRTALYFRLFDAAVDFACAQPARELQSGQTGYRAKLDLGHRLVPLYNLFRHANPVVHAVFRLVGSGVTWGELDADLASWLKAHPEMECPPPRRKTKGAA